MTLETFFEKFDQLADAPEAVAKMRDLLTHFAVSGRLVSNDPREKPVALTLSSSSPHNPALPSNWRCGLLGDAFTFEYGDNLPAPKRTETGEYPVYGSNGIVGTHDTYLTKEPAIIVGRKGSAGALNIATGPSWTTDVAYFVRPPRDLHLRFTYYLFSTLRLDNLGKGIKPGLSRKEAYALPIAIPPLAEQKRIVAKVDELMALCDRLEAQQQDRETRHAALARASLARFADAPTPTNLNFLFHKSYTIPPADLRKSILTLAVQGKLVPQDPTDEPVEDAIRTARKKAHLPGIPSSESAHAESLFEVPECWRWVTVRDVAKTRLGKMLDKEKNRGEAHPYLRNTNVHWFRFELDNIKTMLLEHSELDEYRVQSGDILICEGGHGIGRAAVWDGQIRGMMFQKALHRVRPLSCLDGHFFSFCLWVYQSDQILQRYYTGAGIPHFTGKSLARVSFPLPPIAEQRRIVAKVDQLMALVDQLETQLASSRATAEKLLEAVVAELTTA